MNPANNDPNKIAAQDLLSMGLCKYKTILADPP